MLEPLLRLFRSEDYMPHGMCYLWRPEMLWLHVASDALIAAAYYSIPFGLLYFILRRRDIEFRYMFLLFGLFILACGTTHLMGIWTVWNPDYGIDGSIKAITAIASLGTAYLGWKVMPEALALPSPAQLRQANAALQLEVQDRLRAEDNVRRLNAELERRVQDRTADLEKANRDLSAALGDKEVLLMEVHHRVKNNLQVIVSILTMQARALGDPALMAAFQIGLDRIFAMSRVHEMLYRSRSAGRLDLGAYLKSLAEDLARLHEKDGLVAEIRVQEEAPVELDLDIMTPIALIVNEALTNAFRHGFRDRKQGRIDVRLAREGDSMCLAIADDGSGLRPDWQDESRSLGMKLVRLMARQIDGAVEISQRPGGGTLLVLRWPEPSGEVRRSSAAVGLDITRS